MILSEDAPAKVNLALHVRRRRADGYHDLETIFVFTALGDSLTATPAPALTLEIEGPFGAALAGDDNLVLRAARALQQASGTHDGAALRLSKRIPVAAGLGGGSADAAAALRLLNRLWGTGLTIDALALLGAGLGADVPACVFGGVTFGTGRGEALAPLDPAAFGGTPILLVNPRVAVPTGPVFAAWDGVDRGMLDPAAPLAQLRNDLEPPALAIAPAIGAVLAALRDGGASLARMSGSGATCFGLFPESSSRDAAAAAIARAHPEWWFAATSIR